jgi:hypothetical protein
MTESIENEITPEEKLLKVIQDGDTENVSTPEPAVVAESAGTEPAVTETVVAESAAKPVKEKKSKLKLAKKDADSTKNTAEDTSAAPTAVIADGDATDNSTVIVKSGKVSWISIGFINKILAIIVLLMIGFAVYEIWYNITYSAYKSENVDDTLAPGLVDQAPEDELPPLDEVLTKFAEDPFVGKPEKVKAAPEKVKKVEKTPLEVYVKKNLNLIGLSGDEAIISDAKTDKMHYLKVGGTMNINDIDVSVVGITSEYVELGDGDKKIRIE